MTKSSQNKILVKSLGLAFIFVAVLSFVLLFLRRITPLMFYITAAICAVFAWAILPRLRKRWG